MKVQSLIRNFLWGGKNGSRAVAKVAWDVLIRPKSQGGLALIDPLIQSRALLTKFVVRGLLLGTEAWKGMLLNQLMQLSPKTGGNWLPSLKWMFLTDTRTPRQNLTSNIFLLGIVRAWDAVKIFLRKERPNIWNGWMNQLLLANSLVRDSTGNVLGLRPRLAWGKLDNGPTASIGSWIHFQQMPKVDRLKQLHSIYGVKTMIRDISAAFS